MLLTFSAKVSLKKLWFSLALIWKHQACNDNFVNVDWVAVLIGYGVVFSYLATGAPVNWQLFCFAMLLKFQNKVCLSKSLENKARLTIDIFLILLG